MSDLGEQTSNAALGALLKSAYADIGYEMVGLLRPRDPANPQTIPLCAPGSTDLSHLGLGAGTVEQQP